MSELEFITCDSRQIHEKIITALEDGVSELLYPGDERRIFGEALCPLIVSLFNTINESCRQKLLRYATGEILDAIGETRKLKRITAQKAVTTIRFSVSNSAPSDVIIPKGTRVTGDFERYFETAEDCIALFGSGTVDVVAKASKGGSEYNKIPIGAIDVLTDRIPYVESVTNIDKSSGGVDDENDDSYRERIRSSEDRFTTAGSVASYRYHAMQADSRISDVSVTSPAACEILITPILRGGEIPDGELLAKVLALCSDPNIKPLTDSISVQTPIIESYDIEFTYYTDSEHETDCVAAIEGAGGAIAQYITWQDSAFNRDINPDYLRKLILTIPGISRVEVVSPDYTAITGTTIAKFSDTLTVAHAVV